jgi:hypothetical protein
MGVVLGVAQLRHDLFTGRVIWDFSGPRTPVLQICWDLVLALVVASMLWIRRCLYYYYTEVAIPLPTWPAAMRIYDTFKKILNGAIWERLIKLNDLSWRRFGASACP